MRLWKEEVLCSRYLTLYLAGAAGLHSNLSKIDIEASKSVLPGSQPVLFWLRCHCGLG